MTIDGLASRVLLSPAFLEELQSLETPEEQNDYYLLFHQEKGFSLQRKHSSWGFLSYLIDPIVRIWKSSFGYRYAFEENVKELSDTINREWRHIADTKACVKSCTHLQMIATHVLQKKHKSASELIRTLGKTREEFVTHKAEQLNLSSLEIKSQCELFDDVALLITRGADTSTLTSASKNKLLGYYLDKRNIAVVERLLSQGADPNSQAEKITWLLSSFLRNKHSALSRYYVKLTNNKAEFVKDDAATDLIADVLQSMIDRKYLYIYRGDIFEHNLQKFRKALQANDRSVEDVQVCMTYGRRLWQILEGKTVRGMSPELGNLLYVSLYEFFANRAAAQQISALELACQLKLFLEADTLIDDGADCGSLSQGSKNAYFGYCIESQQYDAANELLLLGANPVSCKDKLRPLLAHCITHNYVGFAVQLIEAGADRGPSGPKRDDSALILATKQGLLPVVQKLVSVGEPLRLRLENQDTLLHVAAKGGHFELLEWLSGKLEVNARSQDAVAYFYVRNQDYFTSKEALERAFLLDDVELCAKILGYLTKDKAAECLNALRKKYPTSCVDHILYSVNKSHFLNKQQIALPINTAPGCYCDELLQLFDQINFSRADAIDYVNSADFYSDTGTNDPYRLRQSLVEFLRKVRHRVAYLGTPQAGSEALEVFYHAIERALTHTIRAIKDMPDSDQKKATIKRTVVEYLRAARYCGGKLYANAYQQYVAVTRGVLPTFKDELVDALGNYREVLFQTLVPQGPQSVHDFNYMMHHLGIELGIPGAEMMQSFHDMYLGEGVNLVQVRREFAKLYSPRNIIFECVKQQVEQSSDMRGKLIDWFKAHLPSNWQQSEFMRIRQEVDSRTSDAEKRTYLETLEIYVAPNQTIEEAIEDERKARYLAVEVVVNMEAAKMEIKPEAIAYMLQQMDILKPVYDWTYYGSVVDMSKGLAKSAWQGAKRTLQSFFIR